MANFVKILSSNRNYSNLRHYFAFFDCIFHPTGSKIARYIRPDSSRDHIADRLSLRRQFFKSRDLTLLQ
jgi:hypothetical protein